MTIRGAAAIALILGTLGTQQFNDVAPKRYSYEEPPPPPNPKADKRKANRVKAMQARKAQRKALSGKKPRKIDHE